MNTFALICNGTAILLILSLYSQLRKRVEQLEKSDVYHHTKTTNVNVCDKIRQHNKI